LISEKKVAILQSNYIPWKGYFDLINMVDEFILFDDMQYTRRDWRNRNQIKTPQGVRWLTIPVEVKGKYFQKINETCASDSKWAREHWKTLTHIYAQAPYFDVHRDQFESLYLNLDTLLLSQINIQFIKAICGILGISTHLSWSNDYQLIDGKTERLVDLCKQAGGTHYISGPSARDYIDAAQFEQAGISLSYMDYSGYPEYPQHYPPFEHRITILDLIFHMGHDAPRYMKSLQNVA
jgi:hypothetical protein